MVHLLSNVAFYVNKINNHPIGGGVLLTKQSGSGTNRGFRVIDNKMIQPPPPLREGYTPQPPPPMREGYTPQPPPPLREGYTPQPPPPLREGYTPQPPPPLREGYTSQLQQPYSQSNEEEPYYILKTNNPYTFYVPDGYDPDHFMPWVHPFTSVISGPTGSGKSVFVRRFVHNIKHMMTPIPDHILWCYGEYQTVYRTVDGVDFHQGLPDLDTLDPREKHLIILDDLMDERDQRVASLFRKKSHHRKSVSCTSFRICFMEENTIEP